MSMVLDEQNAVLERYLTRVAQLYQMIASWCAGWDVRVTQHEVRLEEERHGVYTAPMLRLMGGGERELAVLAPFGESILGAHGRVDLLGALGRREKLVYLLEGGPTLTTRMEAGVDGEVAERTKRLYRGVETDGWYWVTPGPIRRAYLLNRDVFADLLSAVADDGFQP